MVHALGNPGCVIIPAYNEAKSIGTGVEGARYHLDNVLVIDDGSTDATGGTARAAGAHVIAHRRNRGKGVHIESVPTRRIYGAERSSINPVIDTIRFARIFINLDHGQPHGISSSRFLLPRQPRRLP